MRVSNWRPQKFDGEIITASMDRLERAAEVIAEGARQRVPVGVNVPKGKGKWSGRDAGTLKRSIRVVRLHGDTRRNIRIYAGSKIAFYARFVEYGTIKMSARPFLRPALNASKSTIQSILRDGG
jgi:HK97 gp10 family phage protein